MFHVIKASEFITIQWKSNDFTWDLIGCRVEEKNMVCWADPSLEEVLYSEDEFMLNDLLGVFLNICKGLKKVVYVHDLNNTASSHFTALLEKMGAEKVYEKNETIFGLIETIEYIIWFDANG